MVVPWGVVVVVVVNKKKKKKKKQCVCVRALSSDMGLYFSNLFNSLVSSSPKRM